MSRNLNKNSNLSDAHKINKEGQKRMIKPPLGAITNNGTASKAISSINVADVVGPTSA